MKTFMSLNPVLFLAGLFFCFLALPCVLGVAGSMPQAVDTNWWPALVQTIGSALACFWGSYLLRTR